MKRTIIFLQIVLFLAGCTSKKGQEVVFFNDIKFKLYDNEEIIDVDSEKKELFSSYFGDTSVQVPLFKCIKGDDYLVFLGIPINTSIKELSNYSLERIKNRSSFKSDTINFFHIKYRKEDDNITIYSKNFENNLIYVLTAAKSAELSDSLFNKTSLSKRFNK